MVSSSTSTYDNVTNTVTSTTEVDNVTTTTITTDFSENEGFSSRETIGP